MGATPESAGITAQPRLRYLRVRALSNWCFFGWISNGRENYSLASQIPARFTQHHTETGTYPLKKSSIPNYRPTERWPLGWRNNHVRPY